MAAEKKELQEILNNVGARLLDYREKIRSIEAGGVWRGSFATFGDVPTTLPSAVGATFASEDKALFDGLDINDLITVNSHTANSKTGVAIFRYTEAIENGNYNVNKFHFSHWASTDFSDAIASIESSLTTIESSITNITENVTSITEIVGGGSDYDDEPLHERLAALEEALKAFIVPGSDDLMYDWEMIS